jgi:hypothetical protein
LAPVFPSEKGFLSYGDGVIGGLGGVVLGTPTIPDVLGDRAMEAKIPMIATTIKSLSG